MRRRGSPLSLTGGDTRSTQVLAPGCDALALVPEPGHLTTALKFTREKWKTRCTFSGISNSPPGAEKKESYEDSPGGGKGTSSIWPRKAAGPARPSGRGRTEPSVLDTGKGHPRGSNPARRCPDHILPSFPNPNADLPSKPIKVKALWGRSQAKSKTGKRTQSSPFSNALTLQSMGCGPETKLLSEAALDLHVLSCAGHEHPAKPKALQLGVQGIIYFFRGGQNLRVEAERLQDTRHLPSAKEGESTPKREPTPRQNWIQLEFLTHLSFSFSHHRS